MIAATEEHRKASWIGAKARRDYESKLNAKAMHGCEMEFSAKA